MAITLIHKKILDEIENRLKALLLVANGYSFVFKKIKRASLTPWQNDDMPAINFWPTGVTSTLNAYNQDDRELSISVEAYTRTRDLPFTDVCDLLACDVITALNRAILFPKLSDNASMDLGGIVDSFNLESYNYSLGEGQAPFCGVLITFVAKYTTITNNLLV